MQSLASRLAILALLAAAAGARADPLTFSGRAHNASEVVELSFTLGEDARSVGIWTDSYQGGLNFDPLIELWDAQGHLLAWNDDIASSWRQKLAGVGTNDAGLQLANLGAGAYTLTVTNWRNPSLGMTGANPTLDQGFSLPASFAGPYTTCDGCRGQGWWEVNIDSTATVSAVPEPRIAAMLCAGLALAVVAARRRNRRDK